MKLFLIFLIILVVLLITYKMTSGYTSNLDKAKFMGFLSDPSIKPALTVGQKNLLFKEYATGSVPTDKKSLAVMNSFTMNQKMTIGALLSTKLDCKEVTPDKYNCSLK